jgi:hypothetical protein
MKSSNLNFKKLLWVLSAIAAIGTFYVGITSEYGIFISAIFAIGSAFPLGAMFALAIVLLIGLWEGILRPFFAWFFK